MWLYSPVCVGPGRESRRPVFSQRGFYVYTQGAQRRRVVLVFFRNFEIEFFRIAVAISDLVHDVETMYGIR